MIEPTVSVVIPAYNGAAWLPETLKSLGAQRFPFWEAVVVDDCSTDATRALVEAWPDERVRLVTQPENGGPVRARNRGVAEARGRYIAALDQDDLCRPHRLTRQLAYFEAHPDTLLVGTDALILHGGATRASGYAPTTTPRLLQWLLWIENPLVWSSVMLPSAVARSLDSFTRPERLYAEDFDLYQRLSAIGPIARVDEPLVVYRQHAGGVSKRFQSTMRANAAVVLAERHAAALGDRAPAVARLLVDHVMSGDPVTSREELEALGALLSELQARFFAEHACGQTDRSLIRWETAKRWARIGRAALRAGKLTVRDVLAVRPAHLGLGYAGAEALLWSGIVGGVRRLAPQTLAAKSIRPGPSSANT